VEILLVILGRTMRRGHRRTQSANFIATALGESEQLQARRSKSNIPHLLHQCQFNIHSKVSNVDSLTPRLQSEHDPIFNFGKRIFNPDQHPTHQPHLLPIPEKPNNNPRPKKGSEIQIPYSTTHHPSASTHHPSASTHHPSASTHHPSASTHLLSASTHLLSASTHLLSASKRRIHISSSSRQRDQATSILRIGNSQSKTTISQSKLDHNQLRLDCKQIKLVKMDNRLQASIGETQVKLGSKQVQPRVV